jgi:hypothetical protein
MKCSTRHLIFAASLVLGTLGSAISARADFVTVTASIPLQTTDFTNLAVLPVAAFTRSLGTLNSVQISFSASATFDGTLTNQSSTTSDFSLTEFIDFSLNGHSIAALTPEVTKTESYTGVPVGATVHFGPFAPTFTSAPDTFTSGALFNLFNGGGSVSGFMLSTLTGTVVTGAGGNARTSLTTTAGGTMTVTYEFTPTVVPEPASIALIGIGGVVGLVGLRFRRRVNQDTV